MKIDVYPRQVVEIGLSLFSGVPAPVGSLRWYGDGPPIGPCRDRYQRAGTVISLASGFLPWRTDVLR